MKINVLIQPEPGGIDYEASILDLKLFLRPMSSMSEKEEKKYYSKCTEIEPLDSEEKCFAPSIDDFDWLNEHHFDYRGLIPKCLVIKASDEESYKIGSGYDYFETNLFIEDFKNYMRG